MIRKQVNECNRALEHIAITRKTAEANLKTAILKENQSNTTTYTKELTIIHRHENKLKKHLFDLNTEQLKLTSMINQNLTAEQYEKSARILDSLTSAAATKKIAKAKRHLISAHTQEQEMNQMQRDTDSTLQDMQVISQDESDDDDNDGSNSNVDDPASDEQTESFIATVRQQLLDSAPQIRTASTTTRSNLAATPM